MAHFAQIDNNIVKQVIVINNSELLDENNLENETKGSLFCEQLFGGIWKQTSYNGKTRKQFAGIGYQYDAISDVFVAPQPFPSWTIDSNHDWQPPTPMPNDGQKYVWEESSLSWKEIL